MNTPEGIPVNFKPRHATVITLAMKVSQSETAYQWHGNDGWSYSPVFTSQDEAELYPQQFCLKRFKEMET